MSLKEERKLYEEEVAKIFGGQPFAIPNLCDVKFNVPEPKQVEHKCRWCGGEQKPLNNNGILGPGYAAWNWCCISCGRVQM